MVSDHTHKGAVVVTSLDVWKQPEMPGNYRPTFDALSVDGVHRDPSGRYLCEVKLQLGSD